MKKGFARLLLIIITLSIVSISCLSSLRTSSRDSSDSDTVDNTHIEDEDIETNPQNHNQADSSLIWQVNHGANPDSMNGSLGSIIGVGELHIFTDSYDHNPKKFSPLFARGYAFDETAIYTIMPDDNVVAYQISNGTLLWNSGFKGDVIGVGQEAVFVHTDDNRIYGLNKNDGSEIWKIIIESLLPADQDADIYPYVFHYEDDFVIPAHLSIGSFQMSIGFLHFNEITGDSYFTPVNEEIDSLIQPLMYRDNILFCRDTDNLYKLDIMDGSTIWKWSGEDSFTFNSGSLYDGIVGFDQEDETLYVNVDINSWVHNCTYALDLSTGQPVWDDVVCVPEDESEYYCGVDSFSLEKYFFFSYTTSVYVVDKETGARINRISSDYSIEVLPTDEGVIVFTPELGIAEAINPLTNEVYWQDDEFEYDSWYAALDNILFFTNGDRNLVAMNIINGEYLWRLNETNLTVYDVYDNQNFLGTTLNIIKDGTHQLTLLNLETGNISTIDLEDTWGARSDKEHIQIIDDQTWIFFGDHLAVIRP